MTTLADQTKQRFRLPVAVSLLLVKDTEILLSRRYNTGWEDGKYGFVAGHIDGNESFTEALRREAREEIGISIKPKDITFVHATHHKSNKEYLYVFFAVKQWQGEPYIKEPTKCDAIEWFGIKQLPENLVFGTREVIDSYLRGDIYSEEGWQ